MHACDQSSIFSTGGKFLPDYMGVTRSYSSRPFLTTVILYCWQLFPHCCLQQCYQLWHPPERTHGRNITIQQTLVPEINTPRNFTCIHTSIVLRQNKMDQAALELTCPLS